MCKTWIHNGCQNIEKAAGKAWEKLPLGYICIPCLAAMMCFFCFFLVTRRMNKVYVVTFTIIFDQDQSLIWFKIFVKQKKSMVCMEEIKFVIISDFFHP